MLASFMPSHQPPTTPRCMFQTSSSVPAERQAAATSGYPLGAGQSSGQWPMLLVTQCSVFVASAQLDTPTLSTRTVASTFSAGRRPFLPRDCQNSAERRIVDTIGMICVWLSRYALATAATRPADG